MTIMQLMDRVTRPLFTHCANPRAGGAFTALLAILLGACSVEQQLPVGATLSISPQERTLNITDRTNEDGSCTINPDNYVDWPIVLSLTDDNLSLIHI